MSYSFNCSGSTKDEAIEAVVDIRNRVLCPAGPAPTIEELGEIASEALARAGVDR